MTQDYEPIKITESTPEPEEYGTFLVLHGTTVLYVANHMASPVDSYWTDAEGEDCHWSDILSDESGRGTTIQSLAAHDAQIRAEVESEVAMIPRRFEAPDTVPPMTPVKKIGADIALMEEMLDWRNQRLRNKSNELDDAIHELEKRDES